MLTENEIKNLKDEEKILLNSIQNRYKQSYEIIERVEEDVLVITIISQTTDHHIEICYQDDYLILEIGPWTHGHSATIDELLEYIDDIVS